MKGKLKQFWHSVKEVNLKDFKERWFRVINYPQYSIFLLEVFFLFYCAYITFIAKGLYNHIESYSLILLLIGAFLLLVRRWNKDYDIRKTFKAEVQKRSNYILLKMVLFWIISFFVLYLLYITTFQYTSFAYLLLNSFAFILLLEAVMMLIGQSPLLLISLFFIPIVLLNNVGITQGIVSWTFLSLFLVTVGADFFDKNLIKLRIRDKISDGEIVIKKINYKIWVVYLYISLITSEFIINSSYYYFGFIEQFGWRETFANGIVKVILVMLSYFFFIETKDRLSFLIFSTLYRDYSLKISGRYKKVFLDDKKKWSLEKEGAYSIKFCKNEVKILGISKKLKKDFSISDITNITEENENLDFRVKSKGNHLIISTLKTVPADDVNTRLFDVIQINGNDKVFYIKKNSKLISQIHGRTKKYGYLMLGCFWKYLKMGVILPIAFMVLSGFLITDM